MTGHDCIHCLDAAITWQTLRSAGPGGQNVNKVSTAVQLRFSPELSGLPERAVRRLRLIFARRFANDGTLVIKAQEFRSQSMNRRAALERLSAMLEVASREAPRRIPTRPTRGAVARRLESKSRRGAIKRLRGMPAGEE